MKLFLLGQKIREKGLPFEYFKPQPMRSTLSYDDIYYWTWIRSNHYWYSHNRRLPSCLPWSEDGYYIPVSVEYCPEPVHTPAQNIEHSQLTVGCEYWAFANEAWFVARYTKSPTGKFEFIREDTHNIWHGIRENPMWVVPIPRILCQPLSERDDFLTGGMCYLDVVHE